MAKTTIGPIGVTYPDGTVQTTAAAAINLASPGPIGNTTANTAAFTTLSASSTVGGQGFIDYMASAPKIGNTTANTGAFTTLSASSTVGGQGFIDYMASAPKIGNTTANTGAFTTLSASTSIDVPVINGVTDLVIQTGSANAVYVDSSQRVMIGTTTASGTNLLQVNSDALINGVTVGLGGSVGTNTVFGKNGGGGAGMIGGYNTLIGYGSGNLITSGAYNTVVGAFAGISGALDIRTSSNYIVLSDGAGTPRLWFDNNGGQFIPGSTALAGNGYAKLQNGLMIQWGSVLCASAATLYSVTFPVSFASSVFSVTTGVSDTTASKYASYSNPTTTGVQIAASAASTTVSYVVIGY